MRPRMSAADAYPTTQGRRANREHGFTASDSREKHIWSQGFVKVNIPLPPVPLQVPLTVLPSALRVPVNVRLPPENVLVTTTLAPLTVPERVPP